MGKFSDSYYDKNIEMKMRSKLGLDEHEALEDLNADVLLTTFFEVMAPLTMMHEDILSLFEKCKANGFALKPPKR